MGDKKSMIITLKAGNTIFGNRSAGSPFHIYARGKKLQTRAYAVEAGLSVKDEWQLSDFENQTYHFEVYGPNGFFREFKGNQQDPLVISVACTYETDLKRHDLLTGNIAIRLSNEGSKPVEFEIIDNSYKAPVQTITQKPAIKKAGSYHISTAKSFGWYDFSVKIKGYPHFERRYAGRVETGQPTKTDPFMGRVVQ
jgi:phospholipase C